MSFVDKSAPQLVVPSSLEFFKTLPTNLAIQETDTISHNPTSLFNPDSGTITFDVPESSEDYNWLGDLYLTFDAEIVHANNSDLNADEQVGFENNPGDTVFSGVDIELGDQVVESVKHYAHKANMEITLTQELSANNSQNSSTLYSKDTAGNMNALYETPATLQAAILQQAGVWLANNAQPQDPAPTPEQIALYRAYALQKGRERVIMGLNQGLQRRGAYTERSNRVWCRTRPKCDIFRTGKYIPNGVSMRITFHRSKPEFAIHAFQAAQNPQQYKVRIHNPKLWITRAKIFPTVFMGHDRNLVEKPARFNVRRTTIKPVIIPSGTTTFTIDNVTVGQIPRRVLVSFVSNTAYDGSYTENPFNYQHMNLTKIALYVNGKSNPTTPYTPSYTGDNIDYGREYNGLLALLGKEGRATGIDISREDYPNGYCIYGFDLSPDKKAASSTPLYLKKTGNTRLEFQLSVATTVSNVCMIFAEYDNIMKIDGDRNVFINYTL